MKIKILGKPEEDKKPKIEIPDNFLGEPVEGAYEEFEKAHEKENGGPKQESQSKTHASTGDIDLSSYIILPGRTHGNYSYPDLLVAKQKRAYSPEVDVAIKRFGWVDQDGNPRKCFTRNMRDRYYTKNNIGGYLAIEWENALKLNLALESQTLNLRQFFDFLDDLMQGIDSSKSLYAGDGREIISRELCDIYNEIAKRTTPLRGEHLDAYFERKKGALYVYYDHGLDNNQLVPQKSEPLEKYVNEDKCYVDLKSFNKQGLPTKKFQSRYHDNARYWQGENIQFRPPEGTDCAVFTAASSFGARLQFGQNNWASIREVRKKK